MRGAQRFNTFEAPRERSALGAFDVHLDEIDPLEPKIRGDAIDGYGLDLEFTGLSHDPAPAVALVIRSEPQGCSFIPDSGLHQNRPPPSNLFLEIDTVAGGIRRVGLERDNLASASFKSEAGEGTDVPAAVDDHVTGPDANRGVIVDALLHLFPQ